MGGLKVMMQELNKKAVVSIGRFQSGKWQRDEDEFKKLHKDLYKYTGPGEGIIKGIRYVMANHWVSEERYDLVDILIIAEELDNFMQERTRSELFKLLQEVMMVYNEGQGLYVDDPDVMHLVWEEFKTVNYMDDDFDDDFF